MTNLNAAAIDAAVIALKVHGGFDETETDDDPIWREEAETAVSAYLAACSEQARNAEWRGAVIETLQEHNREAAR